MRYQINKMRYHALPSEQMIGGNNQNKYSCKPKNRFNDICEEAPGGTHNTKDKCMDECMDKYIHSNLVRSRLAKETTGYYNLVKDLLAENMEIYLKGGTVLGLYILQDIYKQSAKKLFKKNFSEYLKHNLIRDWDFACYTDHRITEKYRSTLDVMAEKYKMVPRAKTFILYQTKYPIKINDQALFEISILDHNDHVNNELPMTTITVRVTLDNINQIFMLANCFYLYYSRNVPIDIPYVKYALRSMEFIIPPHKNGMYVVNELHSGSMSQKLLDFIKEFSGDDLNLQQFLITHFIEPHRMIYRLLSKNIPKSIKINNMYRNNRFSTNKINILIEMNTYKLIASFIGKLSMKLHNICIEHPNDALDQLNVFFEGVKLDRLRIEYLNISDEGKQLIRLLFHRIHGSVKFNDANQLSKLIGFFESKKLFD